jgi:hypothetical protein
MSYNVLITILLRARQIESLTEDNQQLCSASEQGALSKLTFVKLGRIKDVTMVVNA